MNVKITYYLEVISSWCYWAEPAWAGLMENAIGDRAWFSGVVRMETLVAVTESLLADQAAYDSWQAHMGGPP
jgi:hypothetical protein